MSTYAPKNCWREEREEKKKDTTASCCTPTQLTWIKKHAPGGPIGVCE